MVACVSAFDELTYLRSSSSSSSRSLAARFFALDMVAGRGVRCSCSAGASVKGQRPFDLVFFFFSPYTALLPRIAHAHASRFTLATHGSSASSTKNRAITAWSQRRQRA